MEQEELRKIFQAKKFAVKTSNKGVESNNNGFQSTLIDDFLKWFNIDKFNEGCFYCKITNEESNKLFHLRQQATRGGKRGRRLELDRKDPFQSYDNLENLVWCCYWCNNAKSNFFSEVEFKPIGIAIGEALKKIK